MFAGSNKINIDININDKKNVYAFFYLIVNRPYHAAIKKGGSEGCLEPCFLNKHGEILVACELFRKRKELHTNSRNCMHTNSFILELSATFCMHSGTFCTNLEVVYSLKDQLTMDRHTDRQTHSKLSRNVLFVKFLLLHT